MKIETMNIPAIQEALQSGNLTSEQLVLFYMDRIATIDQGTPKYNSVYMINPDAIAIARGLDLERQQGSIRGGMHGIPVLLKDNINTGDHQTTTGGVIPLKDHFAYSDASLVKTLRERGAIILGKTNLTELACFKSFSGVNGYSSLAGYVLCPWNIEEDPSGSSTGSAVSVALGLAPVSIGTETGGSIMSPSMKNGVVGLKPTIGMVSRSGILPISGTLDTAGPMGKTVADIAVLLGAMNDVDPSDPITSTNPDRTIPFSDFLGSNPSGMRIGIDKQGYDKLSPKRKAAFDNVVSILESSGCTVVDNLNIEQTKRIYHVMKYEFKNAINHYFNQEGLPYTLRDLVHYNRANPKSNLKYGQKVLLDALYHSSGKMNEEDYLLALKERDEARSKLNTVFSENKLDMIYFATYTSLGPHCGFPTLSLPIGLDEDSMPIGTYFLAPYWKEGTLIQIADHIEKTLDLKLNPLKKH